MTISPLSSPLSPDLKAADPVSIDTQATLDRLARSVRLNKAAGLTSAPEVEGSIVRESDSTSFAGVDEALEKLGPLVKRLRATAERFANVDASVLEYEIDRALRPFRESNGGKFPGGIEAELESSYVNDVALKGSGFAAGDVIDLTVEVAQLAEAAGVSLDFGALFSGDELLSSFSFTVYGEDSRKADFSFVSGQTINQISTALASLSDIGVEAVALQSGAGFSIQSSGTGSDAFVSVSLTRGDEALGIGVTIDGEPGERNEFGSYTDTGEDAAVLINGEAAEQVGDYWVASVDGRLDVAVDLDEEAIAAAGGSVSLGTVGKPHPGRGPDGLGAPGQLKKAERERLDDEAAGEPPVDEAAPVSKDATDRLTGFDVSV